MIRILGLRRDGKTDPKIVCPEARILVTQAHEACDEQRRAGEQGDGEGDLCSDQEFAKTLLAQAAGRASPAFLQRIDDVCA